MSAGPTPEGTPTETLPPAPPTGGPPTETPPLGGALGAPPPESLPAAPTWRALLDSLPEEIRSAPYLQNHESFEAFTRDSVGQHRLIGFEKIARPTADSTEEDWNVFHDAMGRPEDPTKYDLGDFAPPENLEWDEGFQKDMIEDLWKSGASQRQVNEVVRAYATRQSARQRNVNELLQQSRLETTNLLKQKWGLDYDQRASMADDVMSEIFGENAKLVGEILLPNGRMLGNEPAIIESFFNLGKRMIEHQMIGEKQVAAPSLSPAEALTQAEAMSANPEIAKVLAKGDLKDATVQKWNRLMELAYPEPAR